jgi:ribosome-associated heat shock protein Hsp15
MKGDGGAENSELAAGRQFVRLDKWLWAARFFKSRSLAVQAIAGGKVAVNGDRVKPAHDVRSGDEIRLRLGPYEHVLMVKAVSGRRGPAVQAALLFEETAESRLAREKLHWQLKHAAPVIVPGTGRPTKKDRRNLGRLKDW